MDGNEGRPVPTEIYLAEYSSAQLLVPSNRLKRYGTLPNISVTEFGRLTDLMRKILTHEPGDH